MMPGDLKRPLILAVGVDAIIQRGSLIQCECCARSRPTAMDLMLALGKGLAVA